MSETSSSRDEQADTSAAVDSPAGELNVNEKLNNGLIAVVMDLGEKRFKLKIC